MDLKIFCHTSVYTNSFSFLEISFSVLGGDAFLMTSGCQTGIPEHENKEYINYSNTSPNTYMSVIISISRSWTSFILLSSICGIAMVPGKFSIESGHSKNRNWNGVLFWFWYFLLDFGNNLLLFDHLRLSLLQNLVPGDNEGSNTRCNDQSPTNVHFCYWTFPQTFIHCLIAHSK